MLFFSSSKRTKMILTRNRFCEACDFPEAFLDFFYTWFAILFFSFFHPISIEFGLSICIAYNCKYGCWTKTTTKVFERKQLSTWSGYTIIITNWILLQCNSRKSEYFSYCFVVFGFTTTTKNIFQFRVNRFWKAFHTIAIMNLSGVQMLFAQFILVNSGRKHVKFSMAN